LINSYSYRQYSSGLLSLNTGLKKLNKPTPEEITRKKELLRHYQNQIYKLTSQQKYLTKQLARIQAQIKDYEKEKAKTER